MSVPMRRSNKDTKPKINCGPGRTQQSEKDSCDINLIMKRFEKTKELPITTARLASYGDFSDLSDFKTSLDRIKLAEETFMALPADVRAHVDNDPQKFLDFVDDEDNLETMIEMGLVPPSGVMPAVPEVVPPKEEETPPD